MQGNTLDEIPFRAAFGVWGSWLGLILCILCLIAQFYVALYPIGGEPNASAFFQAYLACPIIFAFYIFWKIYKRTRVVKYTEVDLQSGRRELNLKELKAQEREEQAHWGVVKRYFPFLLTMANLQGLLLVLLRAPQLAGKLSLRGFVFTSQTAMR